TVDKGGGVFAQRSSRFNRLRGSRGCARWGRSRRERGWRWWDRLSSFRVTRLSARLGRAAVDQKDRQQTSTQRFQTAPRLGGLLGGGGGYRVVYPMKQPFDARPLQLELTLKPALCAQRPQSEIGLAGSRSLDRDVLAADYA